MIRKILGKVLLYALLVWFIVTYWHEYNFSPLLVSSDGTLNELFVYVILWALFWIIYDLIRRVVQIVTKPLSRITLWLVGVLINIVAIYGFAYIVSFVLELGIVVEVWTPLEIVLFSLIVRIVDAIF